MIIIVIMAVLYENKKQYRIVDLKNYYDYYCLLL